MSKENRARKRLPFSQISNLKKESDALCSDEPLAKKMKQREEDQLKSAAPKNKNEVGYDSFEGIPSTSQRYKYKRRPVRKKADRMKLKGQTCWQCEGFYKSCAETYGKEYAEQLRQKLSRHRDNYSPPKTPPGF